MHNIQYHRNLLEQQKGKLNHIQTSLLNLQNEIIENKKLLEEHEQAREIIRTVGQKTQEQLQVNISDITSLALESVFPDPYSLCVNFVNRRNKTECDLYFERDGNRVDPLTASGVGAVDVAAFALRIASWSMSVPHSRNTIILDEPFRFLSENYQEQASLMLSEISKKLGIQMLLITHEKELTTYADRIFEVSIRKGISNIKQS